VTVRRFKGEGDEGQSEFGNVRDFRRGQRFHDRTLVRVDDDRAFFSQGEERLANPREDFFGAWGSDPGPAPTPAVKPSLGFSLRIQYLLNVCQKTWWHKA
jgi:hypothetical protein